MLQTTVRHADLAEMIGILKDQAGARHDVVAPAAAIAMTDGNLVLAGQGEPELSNAGVTATDLTLAPTDGFDSQTATRLGIPAAYYRRMKADAVSLLDTNVNHWLANHGGNFMVRAFRDGNGGQARALLSPSYGAMDHIDFLTGTLTAVQSTGLPVDIRNLSLSESKLRMDIVSPAVRAMAPELMKGYVSPFSGQRGEDLPVVNGGVRFENSETGHGRLRIVPFAEVEICTNGMTMTKFAQDLAFERTHRGSRQAVGVINWSAETLRKRVDALVAEATDVIGTFLDPQWFGEQIARIEATATAPIEAGNAMAHIERVSRSLSFTADEQAGVFAAFIEGRQLTNGGVMQAITAHAQRVADPDRSAHLEERALEALALA